MLRKLLPRLVVCSGGLITGSMFSAFLSRSDLSQFCEKNSGKGLGREESGRKKSGMVVKWQKKRERKLKDNFFFFFRVTKVRH